MKENFENKMHKAGGILNCWLQRDISIFGRILLSKVEYLSRLIYPAFALAPSSGIIKTSNQKNVRLYLEAQLIILENLILLKCMKKVV